MVYTEHGQHIPGTVEGGPKPKVVVDCGGFTTGCPVCVAEANDLARPKTSSDSYTSGPSISEAFANAGLEGVKAMVEGIRSIKIPEGMRKLDEATRKALEEMGYAPSKALLPPLPIRPKKSDQHEAEMRQVAEHYSPPDFEPEVMPGDHTTDYHLKAKEAVKWYVDERIITFGRKPAYEIYVVWFCKIDTNWKALVSTTLPDGMYYEVKYLGKNSETTVTAYHKTDTVVIS